MGLRVADSHTGNHGEDDFMPPETIRRFLGIIGSRSLLSSKGRPSSRRGGLPEPKSSSLVEDDRIVEPVVQNPVRSSSLEVNASEPDYPKSLKEARGHPIEQLNGELNERTLRSKTKQA
ncbi:hypothetical protein Tco_0619491 [Tanacetum coccineum]